ncbi:hypothetical protein FRC04_000879 [Tulasnella sp. 424]|nr:hypothetical protein FRC04_000879 [Tulasnella sp. 424]
MPNDTVLLHEIPPQISNQNQGLHYASSEFFSECFSASQGPLCLRFDTGSDGEVQSVDLVLRLGSDSQFTTTSHGPFENEEMAEASVFEEAIYKGIIQRPVPQRVESSDTTLARSAKDMNDSTLRENPNERYGTKPWHLIGEEKVNQLMGTDEVKENPFATRGPTMTGETRKRPQGTLSSSYISPSSERSEKERNFAATSATFPPLFTNRYEHLPPNLHAPPLQRSYGPPRKQVLSRSLNHTLSKVYFLTNAQELQQYRIEPFSSEEPSSPSTTAAHRYCMHYNHHKTEKPAVVERSVPHTPTTPGRCPRVPRKADKRAAGSRPTPLVKQEEFSKMSSDLARGFAKTEDDDFDAAILASLEMSDVLQVGASPPHFPTLNSTCDCHDPRTPYGAINVEADPNLLQQSALPTRKAECTQRDIAIRRRRRASDRLSTSSSPRTLVA